MRTGGSSKKAKPVGRRRSGARRSRQMDAGRIGNARHVITCLARDYPARQRITRHNHRRHQLIFSAVGVMTVETAQGVWVLPPRRAVWVPGGTLHGIRTTGKVALRTLYIHPGASKRLPKNCQVMAITPLLREIILHIVAQGDLDRRWPVQARLAGLFFDQLAQVPVEPLHLPRPTDKRLLAIAVLLDEDPGDNRTLDRWGRQVGASGRTLARLFLRETGMTFSCWRGQVRLIKALEKLAANEAVTRVASDIGYDSPSAFIAMFKRALGTSPRRYFSAQD